MENLVVFNNELFGEVRFIEVEGKPYAVGKDIAEALGYTNPQKAIRDHCKGVNETLLPTKGGNQMLKIIPEGDIYRLIIRSKLPQADKFEKWVFDEVLPQIRQTGGYIPIKEEDDEATIMAKALMIAQKTIEKKDVIIGQLEDTVAKQIDTIQERDNTIGQLEETIVYDREKEGYTAKGICGQLYTNSNINSMTLFTYLTDEMGLGTYEVPNGKVNKKFVPNELFYDRVVKQGLARVLPNGNIEFFIEFAWAINDCLNALYKLEEINNNLKNNNKKLPF